MKFRTYPEAYNHVVGRDKAEADADPSRVRAAHDIAERCAVLKAQGFKIREWTPRTPGSPARRKDGPYWYWETHTQEGWFDHPYRLITPKGETIFVSEPYDLTDTALRSLLTLADAGWSISIHADWAIHYPGATVAVWIQKGSR